MYPHHLKLIAACRNAKLTDSDHALLCDALDGYRHWRSRLDAIDDDLVAESVPILNDYKDYLELDLILERGSETLKRQRGQLKLDSSILEEYFSWLFAQCPATRHLECGDSAALLGLTFSPKDGLILHTKDCDNVLGRRWHYQFASDAAFTTDVIRGSVLVPITVTEVKVNLDKTMFNEINAVATAMKSLAPLSRYYVVAEYLDMAETGSQRMMVDEAFLIRKAKRLNAERRANLEYVRGYRRDHPICADVVGCFAQHVIDGIQSVSDLGTALTYGRFRCPSTAATRLYGQTVNLHPHAA